ncbi:MAG TPA: nuclear transport factor 2 family protein [Blastocatellia bacterium]|nr:nuclear transport factor 2 family protein [Blastocatellia bacterium]
MIRPNRITSLMLALCLSLAFSIEEAAAQQKKSGDLDQIRAVLDRQVEAWNRRDLEGFMGGYWRSPELTFYSGGTRTTGWDATIERYRKSYQSEGREMGRLSFTEIEIEMLGPRSAFVRGRWNLKMSSGDTGGLFTLIFRKLSSGWKIVHDHTGSSS